MVAQLHLIWNPVAGNGAALGAYQLVTDALAERGIPFSAVKTEYAGHATELAKQAVERGVKKIVLMFSFPADEVGNHLFDEDLMEQKNVNPWSDVLSEAQYRALQQLGDFDRKTSSWILTPADIRALGGALFCDKLYGHVFIYHNGADSYYAARGFRASLAL